jgi:hypothetical protein
LDPQVQNSEGAQLTAQGRVAWLPESRAAAGFLAVAVDHHTNNHIDGYPPQGFTLTRA